MLALFVHWFLRSSLRQWQLRTAPIQMPWPPKRRVAFQMTTSLPWRPQAEGENMTRQGRKQGCQIENCTISRLEVSKLPKNLYLKGLKARAGQRQSQKLGNMQMVYVYIYICMYNYVYIVTGTTERKQWLGRKRLYQYMHTACKCHTCCFSKSRIALIFYCTLPGFRKKFFIGSILY